MKHDTSVSTSKTIPSADPKNLTHSKFFAKRGSMPEPSTSEKGDYGLQLPSFKGVPDKKLLKTMGKFE
jgi:hypothetical protein